MLGSDTENVKSEKMDIGNEMIKIFYMLLEWNSQLANVNWCKKAAPTSIVTL